ncbi:MAG TPA: hypothetical protein VGK33_10165 [Chloroflexota bacterium]|jgi:hypothetical protein
MSQVLTHDFAELLRIPSRGIARRSEDALRVGAATLAHASAQIVTSTTVVVQIGPDDLDALHRVVADIADEHDLDVAVRPHVGWCSVRFGRRGRAPR